MRLLVALCLGLVFVGCRAPERVTIGWQDDVPKALAESKETGKPVMLTFWQEGCPSCEKLDAKTFTDEEVQAHLRWVIPVSVDINSAKGKELAKKYTVYATPKVVFVNAEGERLRSVLGYVNAEDMVFSLQQVAKP